MISQCSVDVPDILGGQRGSVVATEVQLDFFDSSFVADQKVSSSPHIFPARKGVVMFHSKNQPHFLVQNEVYLPSRNNRVIDSVPRTRIATSHNSNIAIFFQRGDGLIDPNRIKPRWTWRFILDEYSDLTTAETGISQASASLGVQEFELPLAIQFVYWITANIQNEGVCKPPIK